MYDLSEPTIPDEQEDLRVESFMIHLGGQCGGIEGDCPHCAAASAFVEDIKDDFIE